MYEEFFQFQAKPFRLSPDARFFFASREHARALTKLRYGLGLGEGIVLITGDPGTGKTTLAHTLLRELNQHNVVVANVSTIQSGEGNILQLIAKGFGLSFEGLDKNSLSNAVETFLLAQSRQQTRVILILDEAQNLTPQSLDELRRLSNFRIEGNQSLLQTFLLAQSSFNNVFSHPELTHFRQHIVANYHIGELREDECEQYIESRMQHVGWNGDPQFTTDVFRKIYTYTQGIPRRINMICDRLLLVASIEGLHIINSKLFWHVTNELQDETSRSTRNISTSLNSDRKEQDRRGDYNTDTPSHSQRVDYFLQPGSEQYLREKTITKVRNNESIVKDHENLSELRKILRFILAYHRSPQSFPRLTSPEQPIISGIKQLLSIAVSDDQVLNNLDEVSTMGLTPTRLRDAVRFFIRQVLFINNADDYRILGLASDATYDQIEQHYGLLKRLIRQNKGFDASDLAKIRESYDRLRRSNNVFLPSETSGQKWMTSDEIDHLELDLDFDLIPGLRPNESDKNTNK